jgi:hypothetical protein
MVHAVSASTTFFPGEGLILYKPPLLERTGWAVEIPFEESGIHPQPEENACFYDRQGHLHRPEKKGFFINIRY